MVIWQSVSALLPRNKGSNRAKLSLVICRMWQPYGQSWSEVWDRREDEALEASELLKDLRGLFQPERFCDSTQQTTANHLPQIKAALSKLIQRGVLFQPLSTRHKGLCRDSSPYGGWICLFPHKIKIVKSSENCNFSAGISVDLGS